MAEDINRILNLAVWAPSGENCQPWRFEVKENKISIFNIPERDQSLYSFGQYSSYVAHGALIENMVIAAKEYGYAAQVSLFPKNDKKNLVAEVDLNKAAVKKDPLFSSIKKRCTNRKHYQTTLLTAEQKKGILETASEIEPGHLLLITDTDKILDLCQATSLNEKVVFENPLIHKFFFNHINWTKEEDDKKSVGFYLETLELPPPAKAAFKLVKHWGLLNVLNKIGFSKVVAKDNFKTHSACAGHGLIQIPNDSPANFILAGRILQRTWLKATSLGLSMQPMTGLIYLYFKIKSGNIENFPPGQTELIKNAYNKISDIFNVPDKTIAMYFRIGQADEPTARSSRLGVQLV
jgi:nitroreductase